MKKSLIFFATAIVACVACNKEITTPEAENVFTITANAPDTKATLDGLQVQWTTGDQVALFQSSSSPVPFTLKGEGPVTTGTFESTVSPIVPNGLAAFPAEGATNDGTKVSVVIPADFEYGTSPVPMVGVSTGGTTFNFSLTTGAAKIAYTDIPAEASQLVLTADKPLSGTLEINDYSAPTTSAWASGAANEIRVTGLTAGDIEVIIPMVAGTYTIEVQLVGSDGTTLIAGSHRKLTGLNIVNKQITPLQAIEMAPDSNSQIYKISHLWLWGGTGPTDNGTKVLDLFKVPTYFNTEDGRGVTALADNYLQFDADGTFTNWAGADGRNWWFVYSATVNPETKKDLDLSHFYDLLPRSTGSYTISENSITFTKSDGSTVTAEMVPAGTYLMTQGNNRPVNVVIESQALKFTITGGTDYWQSFGSDYNVIAKRPRTLFIELEPQSGTVPSESKTTDSDFKYDISFDLMSLPGRWNVYGENAAPFGIWVLGGSGSDPAFISPIEKSWDWNDSIWWESDNGLTINVTGISSSTVSGTTNWWSGNDGKWWDYTWKKTGEDLSRFYNKIPKGSTSFSLDIATMVVTWSNGTTAKILTPGNYAFVYNKMLKFPIPADCFALHFHLMDPISVTSDHYNDVDRFVNAPLEYVIIFEKES